MIAFAKVITQVCHMAHFVVQKWTELLNKYLMIKEYRELTWRKKKI